MLYAQGTLAQLVARRSHNPKVVSSILTGPSFPEAAKLCGGLHFLISLPSVELCWSSGYDARLTRERSPVQSWDRVLVSASFRFVFGEGVCAFW